jgi:proliferating cell nuclear antigen
MISAKMKDAKTWKTCISAMVNIIGEAAFKFTSSGIKVKAMDSSHVALVDFELPASAFPEYKVKDSKTLGINLVEMNKIMSRAKGDEELVLKFEEEKNRLVLGLKGTSTRQFSLPLIDIEESALPEPSLQFPAMAEVEAGVIQDGLKDAEIVGDNVRFEVNKNEFSMSTESDKGSSELKLHKGDAALKELKADQPAKAMFNISYLINMTKAASSSDVMVIHLGTDLPIQLNYQLGGGKGRLMFLLAPRIETE